MQSRHNNTQSAPAKTRDCQFTLYLRNFSCLREEAEVIEFLKKELLVLGTEGGVRREGRQEVCETAERADKVGVGGVVRRVGDVVTAYLRQSELAG